MAKAKRNSTCEDEKGTEKTFKMFSVEVSLKEIDGVYKGKEALWPLTAEHKSAKCIRDVLKVTREE